MERKVWILENGDIDVTKLINDVESKKELSFQDKQKIIENFLFQNLIPYCLIFLVGIFQVDQFE